VFDEGLETDLMDPDHVPRSIAQGALTLIESVATWPLRRSILGTWYQNLRGTSTDLARDQKAL
jgi:hypothetical protein